jgi:hypothetical protein
MAPPPPPDVEDAPPSSAERGDELELPDPDDAQANPKSPMAAQVAAHKLETGRTFIETPRRLGSVP